jgi:DNA-binding MarR family transcriptional regulator
MTLKKTVSFELHTLTNLMKRESESSCLCKFHRQTDLTDMQSRIIGFLHKRKTEDVFQKDIESEFSIRRPTVSILLQTMEKKNLVKREAVAYDARLKKVELTPKAEELVKSSEREMLRFEKMLTSDISQEDLACFFRVTEKIRENLEENKKTPAAKWRDKK